MCFNGSMAITVQAILQEHFEAFANTHPLAAYQQTPPDSCSTAAPRPWAGTGRVAPTATSTRPTTTPATTAAAPCRGLGPRTLAGGLEKRLLDCPHNHSMFTTPKS